MATEAAKANNIDNNKTRVEEELQKNASVAGDNVSGQAQQRETTLNGGRSVVQRLVEDESARLPEEQWTDKYGEQMASIYDKLLNDKELTEAEKKRKKRQQVIAGIGDMVSALSNLFFTTKGAPNSYMGKSTLSEANKKRWATLESERARAAEDRYNNDIRAINFSYNAEKERRKEEAMDLEREKIKYQQAKDKNAADLAREKWEYKQKQDALENENKKRDYEQKERFHRDNVKARNNRSGYGSGNGNGRQVKQIVFSDDKGNGVYVYDNVWRGNMQKVFDAMVADGAGKGTLSDTRYRLKIDGMSPSEKEDFVKQHWRESPEAVRYMGILSNIGPTSYEDGTTGGLGWGNDSGNNGDDW